MLGVVANLLIIGLFFHNSQSVNVDKGTKFESVTLVTDLHFSQPVLRKVSGVDSLIKCVARCKTHRCGSLSYQRDTGMCIIYDGRLCYLKKGNDGSTNTVYFVMDDDSGIDGCEKPKDCQEIQTHCSKHSGVYTIYPPGINGGLDVYCEMREDGGWTTFQRRIDGSENFYRGWEDYKNGFGNLCGEFWLGNGVLHLLTNNGEHKLKVDLEDFDSVTKYADYSVISVASENDLFRLTVSGFSGNAGDALNFHDGRQFSTKDKDNDNTVFGSCAKLFKGGWWYASCYSANLNGIYEPNNTDQSIDVVSWNGFRELIYSLKKTTMKFKRKN